MDNLKKFEFEKLDSSEMKEVQGGNLFDDIINGVEKILPLITPLITGL